MTLKKNKPWLSNGLRTSIKAKRKLYRKYIRNPLIYGIEYRARKNLLTTLLNNARNQYYENLLKNAEGNSKETWKTINKILGRDHRANNIGIKIEGNQTTLPRHSTPILMKYRVRSVMQ